MKSYQTDLLTMVTRKELTEDGAERLHEKRMVDLELQFHMVESQKRRREHVNNLIDNSEKHE